MEKLSDSLAIPYIAVVVFVANDFEVFLKTFQTVKSKIHVLYSEMGNLIRKLMSKFVRSKFLLTANKDGSKVQKSISEISTVNPNDPKQCKPLRLLDVGTKAKNSFADSLEMSDLEKRFRKNCLQTFQV